MNETAERKMINNMTDEEISELFSLLRLLFPDIKKQKNEIAGPLEKLNSMTGLIEFKQFIREIIAENKLRAVALSRGRIYTPKTHHACFIGNPGTGKTTMARLYGDIMYAEGLQKEKTFVCASRPDLIGDHCGETALKTRAAVERAAGGVLFVDEAYSLYEGGRNGLGGFGDECISTLVEEIENNRDKFTLIMAGYPEQMNELLKSNPGLQSRIPHIINFPDYEISELVNIANNMANDNGFFLGNGVREKLYEIFNEEKKDESFGNARLARNLIEKAITNKALSIDYENVSKAADEDIFCLNTFDFSKIKMVKDHLEMNQIGFV